MLDDGFAGDGVAQLQALVGNAAQWNISWVSPSTSNMRNTFGPSWMPAPISLNSGACSSTCTGMPLRDSASAVASPPMPPPTTSTGASFAVMLILSRPANGSIRASL